MQFRAKYPIMQYYGEDATTITVFYPELFTCIESTERESH